MKIINRPLTDINNRDFITGEYVKPVEVKQNLRSKIDKRVDKKMLEAIEKGRVDWKIYVEWLGRVKI